MKHRNIFQRACLFTADLVLPFTTVIILICLSHLCVYGEEITLAEYELRMDRKIPMEHEGMPGFWFHRELALAMLEELETSLLYQREISLISEQLIIRESQLEHQDKLIESERRILDRAVQTAKDEADRSRELEDRLHVWWRSPVLWVSVGVVLTIALEVAAMYLYSVLRPP